LSRAAVAVLTRVLLVIFTFVLIVVLAQIALVAARTRFDHAPIGDILQQAWEGTQDYFSSLFQGSLGEATSTSILGGRRRSMGEVLLDAYPKSILLVGLAVTLATMLGVAVGVVAAATHSRRLRALLVGSTMAVISLPSFLLAILLMLLSAEMVLRASGEVVLQSVLEMAATG
jgi:ABC-type dipeptide/oligopeptide/nickel transport system permease component